MTDEDARARNRFFALSLVRFGGVAMVMLGFAIAESDMLQPGGMPQLGLPIVVLGLVETLFLPRFLARKWRTPPGP